MPGLKEDTQVKVNDTKDVEGMRGHMCHTYQPLSVNDVMTTVDLEVKTNLKLLSEVFGYFVDEDEDDKYREVIELCW